MENNGISICKKWISSLYNSLSLRQTVTEVEEDKISLAKEIRDLLNLLYISREMYGLELSITISAEIETAQPLSPNGRQCDVLLNIVEISLTMDRKVMRFELIQEDLENYSGFTFDGQNWPEVRHDITYKVK